MNLFTGRNDKPEMKYPIRILYVKKMKFVTVHSPEEIEDDEDYYVSDYKPVTSLDKKLESEYSDKELLLFKTLGVLKLLENYDPIMLYRQLALICFMEKRQEFLCNIVRNCCNHLFHTKNGFRMTKEFDDFITL